MAYDQYGRTVPDGTPGSSPTPPPMTVPGAGAPVGTGVAAPAATSGFGVRGTPIPGYRGANPVMAPPATTDASPGSPLQGPPAPASAMPGGTVDPTNAGGGGGANALGFNPNVYGQALNDPGLVSTAYNMNSGLNPNSGSYALNDQYGKNLDYVYALLNGRNVMGASPEDYFNWSQNYMQQGSTPGGQHISTGDVLAALFSNDPLNPVYQTIYGPDANGNAPAPGTVVNRFIGVMQQGMANEAPPMVISAMTSMYAQAGKEWQVLVAQGKFNGSYTDYLQQKGLGPQMLTGGQ